MRIPTSSDETAGKTYDDASDRFFFRIAASSTALAFGALFATVECFRRDATGFTFHVSGQTAMAFVLGSIIGFIYWRIVSPGPAARSSGLVRLFSLVLMLGGVAALLYPLCYLPAEKLAEILKGLATAVLALSFLGLMLWRIGRSLDAESTAETGVQTTRREPRVTTSE